MSIFLFVMSKERDWHTYNEALVRRGELELDSSVIEEWNRELKKENDGKVGEPYHYPESYIRLLAFVRLLFHMPYRETEGFVHFLSKHIEGLKVPDYSTIDRRTNKLDVRLDESLVESNSPVTIAVDSSGIKVHNGGDWIRHVWKVKRGYLKIHLAVDARSKQAVSLQVTEESVSDGSQMEPHVQEAMSKNKVGRAYADGAYDSRANFNFLAFNKIDPAIKVRKNAVPKAKGSFARKEAVIEQQRDFEGWKKEKGYGDRWAAEGAFSCIKRIFGEYVSARKFVNMAREMAMKASIYNRFITTT